MASPTHILVIRLSAMGDVAMTVPVIRVVAATYPHIKFTVVSRGQFEPLFKNIENVDFLVADVYGKHKGFGIIKLANQAKALGVDAVADLHNVIRSKLLTNYLKLKGIRSATIDKGRAEKKALTREVNKDFRQLKTTHQRYADVFSELGLPVKLNSHSFPERSRLSAKLNSLIGVEPKKLIGIAPFAAFDSKMYPLTKMKEVLAALDETDKFRIFLFGGGKKEIAILKDLEKPFNNVVSLAGRVPFEEELALISNLDLMLSMDSGNGHLSALYGIPTVTLWGVTHPFAGFAPFMQPESNMLCADRTQFPLIPTSVYGNKFPEGYDKAIASITPKSVVKKVLEIL